MLALNYQSGAAVGTVRCVVWCWNIQSWSSASAICEHFWIQILSLLKPVDFLELQHSHSAQEKLLELIPLGQE